MAERIDGVSFTLEFRKRVTLELAVLNQKLSIQLRDEINRAFEQSLYTDLEINVSCGSIKTHSCIVQTRVPKFYSKVCENKHCIVLPDKTDHQTVEAFIRTLYTGDDIDKEESDILQKLGNIKYFYKQLAQHQALTPESDVYLTPQASPSEVRCTSLHTRCLSDSSITDELTTSKENLRKNNALYYSLVPVDEIFDSDGSGGVLEKELAEQDELLESFKSILSKERKNIKTKKKIKPTSLTLTSSHNPKHTNINDSIQKIYSKRKLCPIDKKINNNSKDSCSNQENKNFSVVDNVKSTSIGTAKRDKVTEEEEERFYNSQSTNFDCSLISDTNQDVDSSSISDVVAVGSQSNMNKILKVESSHKESDDAMSNPETEVIGQDSVLDAGSSGYVTGSSPRDHTVSEAYGVDVTEAASSEDIPHDNDRSAASSSVSSDAGTWDSTFPATMEEELTPNHLSVNGKTAVTYVEKTREPSSNETLKENKLINDRNLIKNGCSNLPDLVQVENNVNNVDLFQPVQSNIADSPSPVQNKFGTVDYHNHRHHHLIIEDHHKQQTKHSQSDKTSDKSVDIASNDGYQLENNSTRVSPDNNVNTNHSTNSDNISSIVESLSHERISSSNPSSLSENGHSSVCSKTNFFIDASSLLDESELAQLQATSLLESDKRDDAASDSGTDAVNENKTLTDNINKSREKIVENDDCCESSRFILTETKLTRSTSQKVNAPSKDSNGSENLTFEERRSSLIRRNTFELEPDDEKLAILRHEYERRQGNTLFDSSSNENIAKEGSCKNEKEEENITNNIEDKDNSPKKQPPDSLFIIPKNQQIPFVVEDDMHSPDSLNNDAPLDSMFEDKTNEERKSVLDKVNKEGNTKTVHIQDIEDDSSKSFNSGSFYNVDQNIEQSYKYGLNKSNFEKEDDSSLKFDVQSENGSSSRFSDCSSTLSRSSAYVGSADRLNRIESMPIVSGGASISDFSPPVSCASPLTRRKTEFTPILSGGAVLMPEPEVEQKPKPKTNSVFTASWVVDMSDAVKSPEVRKKKRTDSGRSSGSSEQADINDDLNSSKSEQRNFMKTSNPALGFFIPLDDAKLEKPKQNALVASQTKSTESTGDSKTSSQSNLNSSCGFYIDLNKSSDQLESLKEKSIEKNAILPDKKLFSMFIDISETSSIKSTENGSPKSKTSSPNLFTNKKVKPKSLANRFYSKHNDEIKSSDSPLSSESSIELSEHPEVSKGKHLFPELGSGTPPPSRQISTIENSTVDLTQETRKKGFFMFIEAENFSPVPRRKTLPSGLRPTFQRHSWNLESRNVTHEDEGECKKEHKRAHSVSVDRTLMFNVSCDEKKSSSVTSLAKNSSKEFSSGIFESGPASIDEATMRLSEKNSRAMISSWHGPVKPSSELQKVLSRSERKDMKESKTVLGLSRTLENSKQTHCHHQHNDNSENSITCSCRSDETFDIRSESNMSDLSSHSHRGNNSTFIINDISNVANATSNELDVSTPSHEIVSELSKDESEPASGDITQTEEFIDELSCKKDSKHLVQHVSQPLQTVKEETKSSFVKLSDLDKEPVKLVIEERKTSNRMSRSIPEASWIESKIMTRSATSRSLGRLFPHLNTRTPENDDINFITDASEMSSMQSSIEPSVLEGSTEDTDASSSLTGPCSRLGEDLLRMFLEEISPDVTVEVGGRRIKAHKCILSSRCQYFAAMLSGGWVESAGNVISLQGFSYNAVHFALCHIYSGASNIPDSINIVELATLADMLCLEGLKEVIMYTLKVKYCHFFHKPCPLCTVGVLECLPLAAAYGLDEIYRKSLRWITKYFVRVWPTKGFATLPRELIDKCLKQHIVHMSVENVLDTVMCCEKLEATVPQVRWADPVFAVIQRLHDTAVKYITQHFSGVLSSEMFLSFGKDMSWNLDRLEKTLVSVCDRLSPDQACRSHSRLHTILTVAESSDPPPEMVWNSEFIDVLRRIAAGVETSLIKQAGRAARTPAWAQMEPQLRHRIQDAACLVIIPGDDRRRARHSSLLRRSEGSSSTGLRSSDLHQVKVVMSQQNVGRKTISDTTTTTISAATAPMSAATKAANRASVPNTKTGRSDENAPKTKSWPYKLAEVKSRYLEQRTPVKNLQTTAATGAGANTGTREKCWSVPAQRKNPGKTIISSSDSSRTSSPAMRRSLGARTTRTLMNKDASKKDAEGLTMSTDSLVENAAQPPKPSGSSKVKTEPSEINGNIRTQVRSEKARRGLPNKIDGIKTKSAESLTKVNGETKPLKSHSVSGSQNIVNKEGGKLKTSPVPLSKKASSQNSPRVKESPIVSRAKPVANSTPSPAMRRNNVLAPNNQQNTKSSNETKSTTIKRTSTYRVQNRTTLSPTKTVNKAREPLATTSNNKGNINNPTRLQKTVNNNASNASSPLLNRVKQQPQLTVGSRSGTFLKDEPTVIRKPQPANVD